MSEQLSILKSVYDEVIEHSKALKPVESCGYLAGTISESPTEPVDLKIITLHKMTNLDNEPDHFTFDPKEQFAALKAARSEGQALLAVYHSHPESPARPSQEDLRLLKDPNMIYVIVSLEHNQPDMKAYRIVNEVVTELTVIVKEGA